MDELAALTTRLLRRLTAAEAPILERHGLSMWQYSVLVRLTTRTAPVKQVDLARDISYDKTRLITLLDGLEDAGLVRRDVARDDRRARWVGLTDRGRTVQGEVHDEIAAMEGALLAELDPADAVTFRAVLRQLAGGSTT